MRGGVDGEKRKRGPSKLERMNADEKLRRKPQLAKRTATTTKESSDEIVAYNKFLDDLGPCATDSSEYVVDNPRDAPSIIKSACDKIWPTCEVWRGWAVRIERDSVVAYKVAPPSPAPAPRGEEPAGPSGTSDAATLERRLAAAEASARRLEAERDTEKRLRVAAENALDAHLTDRRTPRCKVPQPVSSQANFSPG
jgi:hypothetical protein